MFQEYVNAGSHARCREAFQKFQSKIALRVSIFTSVLLQVVANTGYIHNFSPLIRDFETLFIASDKQKKRERENSLLNLEKQLLFKFKLYT